MIINLFPDCRCSPNSLDEYQIQVDRPRSYVSETPKRVYTHDTGDTAQTLDRLLTISLAIAEGFWSVSDKLGTYMESNGYGSYCDVYRLVPIHQSIGWKETVTDSRI